jgi:L-seryl-tRNA(Ser) seleniumtransferase
MVKEKVTDKKRLLEGIPKVDKLKRLDRFHGMNENTLTQSIRASLDKLRDSILSGNCSAIDERRLCEEITKGYRELSGGTLLPIINASGVVIHTNLGRSPLPFEAVREIERVAEGYSNLEYDLEEGRRGDRYHHMRDYLKILTGAEDSLVINNNASAVFLILNTFSAGKETIVSRGELVEIGGSFRIPEVMAASGALLKEVGTTNKTRISDYENAVNPGTAMMMKVHKSNYSIVGFSEETDVEEIAGAAKKHNVLSYYDAGSGLIKSPFTGMSCDEPCVSALLDKGLDLVSISGDKLLGGPQAGIILGCKELIDKLKKNQLLRMLRVDKLTLAALQAVLRLYAEKQYDRIPVYRMLTESAETVRERAEKLISISGVNADIVAETTGIGGGSCPSGFLPTFALKINSEMPAHWIEKMLRGSTPPVIARIKDNACLLDMRTVRDCELPILAEILGRGFNGS